MDYSYEQKILSIYNADIDVVIKPFHTCSILKIDILNILNFNPQFNQFSKKKIYGYCKKFSIHTIPWDFADPVCL